MKLPAATSGSFEKCPAGNHLAVCYEVVEMGTQEGGVFGPKHQIWIGWETPNETMEDGRPFVIGKRYNLSMNEKATLRLHLESWRGKKFTDADLGESGSFEIQNLIGKACFLNVVHTEKEDRVYANINAVAPLPKGVESPELTNERIFVALNKEEFVQEDFDKLSERMQELIQETDEYRALKGRPKVVVPDNDSGTDDGDIPF